MILTHQLLKGEQYMLLTSKLANQRPQSTIHFVVNMCIKSRYFKLEKLYEFGQVCNLY